jgi:serine/threonine-protein kinase
VERRIHTFGDYLLLKELGSGGTSTVHLAVSMIGEQTPVVVKRLRPEHLGRINFFERFRREAELAKRVNSPHVAKVIDSGMVDGAPFIVMEYVRGWTIERVVQSSTNPFRLPLLGSVVEIIAGGLEGLAALHEARDPGTSAPMGIVHRDISPKNVMLGEDGRTRLIDLGLGRSSQDDWKTQTGFLIGTPGYFPPEQVASSRVDHRADLYALGVVMFELLTLRPYVERGSMTDMLRALAFPRFIPPSSLRSDVPRALDQVLEIALRPDPNDRFPSARSFLDALRIAAPLGTGPRAIDLVDDLLWAESSERGTEVTRLLAQATYVEPTVARDLAPTSIVPLRTPTYVPRASSRIWLGVLVFLLLAAIGVLVGLNRSPGIDAQSVQQTTPQASARAVPTAHAANVPQVEAESSSPGAETRARSGPWHARRRVHPREEATSSGAAAAPEKERVPVAVSADDLLDRARALETKLHGKEKDRIRVIISDLVFEQASKGDARGDRIRGLERQLAELESGGGS